MRTFVIVKICEVHITYTEIYFIILSNFIYSNINENFQKSSTKVLFTDYFYSLQIITIIIKVNYKITRTSYRLTVNISAFIEIIQTNNIRELVCLFLPMSVDDF